MEIGTEISLSMANFHLIVAAVTRMMSTSTKWTGSQSTINDGVTAHIVATRGASSADASVEADDDFPRRQLGAYRIRCSPLLLAQGHAVLSAGALCGSYITTTL